MVAVHGKDAGVYVHGYDLTAYFRSFTSPFEVDTADVSAFRDVAKKYLVGLKDGSLSGEGLYDGAVGAADEVLAALLQGEDKVVSYFPNNDIVGRRGYAALCEETSYEITSDIGDAVGFAFEAQADGLEPVVSLLGGQTAIVASGNQSIVDNGAQTTNGGAAYLHSLTKVGFTTADITLRHSSDNFGADDTLLATFAQVGAAGLAERVAIAGTIKRYVRAVVTLGGGGTSWRFAVALHRK